MYFDNVDSAGSNKIDCVAFFFKLWKAFQLSAKDEALFFLGIRNDGGRVTHMMIMDEQKASCHLPLR